jgi:hypothetical protein
LGWLALESVRGIERGLAFLVVNIAIHIARAGFAAQNCCCGIFGQSLGIGRGLESFVVRYAGVWVTGLGYVLP